MTVAGRAFQRPEAFDEEFVELTRRIAVTLDATPVTDPAPDDLAAPPPVAPATSAVGQTEGDDR